MPELIEGTGKLSDGANKFKAGINEYENGVLKASGGASKLNDGAQSLNAGLNEFGKGLDQFTAGVGEIQKVMNSLLSPEDIKKLNDYANALNGYANALGQVANIDTSSISSLSKLLAGFDRVNVDDLSAIASALEQNGQDTSSLKTLIQAVGALQQSGAAKQLGAMSTNLKGLSVLKEKSEQLSVATNGVAAKMEGAVTKVNASKENLAKLQAGSVALK